MACRGLLDLQELAFDRPHSGHQAVKLGQEDLLVLLGFLDEVGRRAVANPAEGIGQLHVQEPHGALQVEKFLM